ncbi:hypothetical protein AMS68_007761 [Peltaster fructicola]|uniref:Thioesterase domain-containing protein n=1 Tax=Peltaster fructicola TaxID=286661 RepID=A0A6H0Y5F5_9PEZI|nr:hypothetical protein AMS68_007761 [Peltaster fructicola]
MKLRPSPIPFVIRGRIDSLTPRHTQRHAVQLLRYSRSHIPFNTVTRQQSTVAAETVATVKKPSRLLRFATTSTLAFVAFAIGLSMSAAAAVDTVNGFINPPTDAETLTMFVGESAKAQEVDEHIKNHPLAVKLRATPGMKESRPHLKIPVGMRPHNLTGGVLLGDGKIEVPPLVFADNEAELPSLYSISYLGKSLCGHPGIIHGGLLATMLDEGLARACFPALPNKVGVTASLKIDYRIPCPAGRYVVLKAFTTKVEGRKAWVQGWIELLDDGDDGSSAEPKKLVEAEALFIEPKNAAGLAKIYSGQ